MKTSHLLSGLLLIITSTTVIANGMSLVTVTENGLVAETKENTGTPVGVKGIASGFLLIGDVSSIGVEGISHSTLGTGVKGSGSIYGVYGSSSAGFGGPTGYGVYGKAPSFGGGYGLYSEGNAHVQGDFSVSGNIIGNLNINGNLTSNNALSNYFRIATCMNNSGTLGRCAANALSYSSRIAYVGDGPGSYYDLPAALTDAGNWCLNPDADNKCVIILPPGIQNLAASISIPSYMIIQGAGKDVSIIRGSSDTGLIDVDATTGVELKDLNVEVTGPNIQIAVSNSSSIFGLTLSSVRLRAESTSNIGNGTTVAKALSLAACNNSIILEDVSAYAASISTSQTLTFDWCSNVRLDNVDADYLASLSLYNAAIIISGGTTAYIRNSHIRKDQNYLSGNAVSVEGTGNTVYISHSEITELGVTDVSSNRVEASFSDFKSNASSLSNATFVCNFNTNAGTGYTSTCP